MAKRWYLKPNTWWQRNKPVIFTQVAVLPLLTYYYWPDWSWAVLIIGITSGILLGIDTIIWRNSE